mgnify:CR=1 FL=1
MAKRKYIKCFCSKVGKPQQTHNKDERSIYSESCECTVDGKHLTKRGRDYISVAVIESKRKGYEAF